MKVNIKLTGAGYDEETGESFATISTDIGEFIGYAKLNPEDAEIASNYAGCRYAEMRADIQYMKQKARISEYKMQPLKKIYNDLKQRNNFNPDNIGIKLLEKEIYILEDEKEFFKTNVQTLTTRLDEAIHNRPDLIKEIEKHKDK